MSIFFAIALVLFAPHVVNGATFSGIIKDENGETLPGANIVSVTKSDTGCITDFDGAFSCEQMPEDGNVSISYVGYESLNIQLKKSEENNIVLKESANNLEEVVVSACDKETSKWDDKAKTCKCNDENLVWNKEKQVCESKKEPVKPAKNPDEDLCKKESGDWDTENQTCNCKKDNTKWNTETKKCEKQEQTKQPVKTKEDKKTQPNKEKLNEAKQKYEEAKANEQSTANKTLTAVTTAATGIGGMELARGLAEQKADKEADADMTAYIETMRCTYGDGKQVKAGPEEIELPGGNNAELMKLRSEYFALASDLKERKEALGMKPGIESEVIMDKSQMGLYDDENIGITDGAYASLYRAKALNSEKDQARINEDKEASKKRVIGGAVAVAAGAVIGIAGNAIINKKSKQRTEYEENYLNLALDIDNLKSISSNSADQVKLNNTEMTDIANAISGYTSK